MGEPDSDARSDGLESSAEGERGGLFGLTTEGLLGVSFGAWDAYFASVLAKPRVQKKIAKLGLNLSGLPPVYLLALAFTELSKDHRGRPRGTAGGKNDALIEAAISRIAEELRAPFRDVAKEAIPLFMEHNVLTSHADRRAEQRRIERVHNQVQKKKRDHARLLASVLLANDRDKK